MENIKYLIWIITLAACVGIFTGCTPKIELNQSYYAHPFRLVFWGDSTFSYAYHFQFAHQHSSGVWRKKGAHEVELNSYLKSRMLSAEAKVSDLDGTDKSNLLSIQIDDTRMPSQSLDSLHTEKLAVNAVRGKRIDVRINVVDSLLNYRVFDGQVLKLKRKGIGFYEEEAQHTRLLRPLGDSPKKE